MKTYQILFLSICIFCLPSTNYAENNLPLGTFRYDGYVCQDILSLTSHARKINENFQFGNEETILQIAKDQMTIKTKLFSFDGYREDHCIAQTIRKFTTSNYKIEISFLSREVKPNGKYGQLACDKMPEYKDTSKYSFTTKDQKLFLIPLETENEKTKVYCNKGLVYLSYSKVANTDFTARNRPVISQKEKDYVDLIKISPPNESAHSNYILYLLRERRLDDGEIQIADSKKIFPKSAMIAQIEKVVATFKTEKDRLKREKDFNKALLNLALNNAKEAFKEIDNIANLIPSANEKLQTVKNPTLTDAQRTDLAKMPQGQEVLKSLDQINQNMAELQKALDPNTIKAEQEALKVRDEARKEELKTRYHLSEVASKQYDPSSREYSTTSACRKAFTKNKTDSLKLIEKASKDFPNSPYILQEHLILLLQVEKFSEAEQILTKESGRYPNEIRLKILAEYMPKYRVSASPQERNLLTLDLRQDFILLGEALAEVSVTKEKK